VDGVIHYCVANMPGAVPRTSTLALTNATLPYVRALADLVGSGLQARPGLAAGLNVHAGEITHEVVAKALGLTARPAPAASRGARVAPVWRDQAAYKGRWPRVRVPLGYGRVATPSEVP